MTKKAVKAKPKPKAVKAKSKPKAVAKSKPKSVAKSKPKSVAKEVKKLQKFDYTSTPLKIEPVEPVNVARDLPAVPARIGETFDLPDVPKQESKPTEKQLNAIKNLQKAYRQNKGGIKAAKAEFTKTHGIKSPTRAELASYIKDLPAPEALLDPSVWKRLETREKNVKDAKKAHVQATKAEAKAKKEAMKEAKKAEMTQKKSEAKKAKAEAVEHAQGNRELNLIDQKKSSTFPEAREKGKKKQAEDQKKIRDDQAFAGLEQAILRHKPTPKKERILSDMERFENARQGPEYAKTLADKEFEMRRDAEIDVALKKQFLDGVQAEAYYADRELGREPVIAEPVFEPVDEAAYANFRNHPVGDGLSGHHVNKFVQASYAKKKHANVEGYELDRELSTKNNKVYRGADGKVVVANAGTSSIADWWNNKNILFGNYDKTARYKEVEDVQKKAIEKYGLHNITNVAHSQSGEAVRLLSKKGLTQDAIAVNPAIIGKPTEGVNVIRSSGDWVSAFTPTQGSDTVIKASTFNPLVEHSSEIINQGHVDRMFGKPDVVPMTGQGFNVKPFQAQFRVYKRLHPVKDLKAYAEYILENPHEFQNVTFQRAVHYLKK